jgi:hypothetical protein
MCGCSHACAALNGVLLLCRRPCWLMSTGHGACTGHAPCSPSTTSPSRLWAGKPCLECLHTAAHAHPIRLGMHAGLACAYVLAADPNFADITVALWLQAL